MTLQKTKQMKTKISPTTRTQEKILEYLDQERNLVSVNHISKTLGIDWYSAKASIEFLHKLGIVELFPSNTESLLIRIKREDKNGVTTTPTAN
jgi:Mn-dependent DtxR family transcriptional regulator